jgi:CRP-like cAMP-binding protein
MSFLTNATHTATAIAITDVKVWVLRKQDFEDLLLQSESLRETLKDFIQQDDILYYLKERQQLDDQQTDQWVQKTVKRLDKGKLIPSPAEVAEAAQTHNSAPSLSGWACYWMASPNPW